VGFGETSVLLTGDAERRQEEYLVEEYGEALDATVMKAGHHGSKTSTSGALLDAVAPRAVVVSSAYDSQYGHPHDELLDRLGERSIPTYWTATHGDVVVVSDADAIGLRSQRAAPTDPPRIREGDPEVGPPPADVDRARFESDAGREAYADRVRRVKEYVREGDTFQANVSHRLAAPAAVHPVEAFTALRAVNPAPYSGLVEFRGVDLVSASPELLLDVDGRRVTTEPIAGTRPRGDTPDADRDLVADLLSDDKERAEHAMLVDLERNDLGKVCEHGSVAVSEYRRVDRYSEVMHLVSLVEGRLRDDASVTDAVAGAFPGGTITGAPKPRTMEIIDGLEATRRGPYTGSIAAFGFDGRATLNIVIRTLVRVAEEYHLRVGAGVVHDSDPDREYEETLDKARALVAAVDDALAARADLEVEGG
jgi:anthranilate synthase component 1